MGLHEKPEYEIGLIVSGPKLDLLKAEKNIQLKFSFQLFLRFSIVSCIHWGFVILMLYKKKSNKYY